MKRLKNQGITLIALVITIIVLLILAGVTIATLSGENGILIKGTTAKEKTERETVIEKTRTEILAMQAENNGNLTKAQMIIALEKFFQKETIPDEKELPEDMSIATQSVTTKEEYGNYKIQIADIWNGKFSKEENFSEASFNPEKFSLGTEAKNTERYGWKVKDYTVTTEKFTTGIWRLFHQDDNYTYLITDECVGNYKPSEWYTKYETASGVNIIGQKLNSTIIEQLKYEKLFSWPNRRTTEWLTNPTIWEEYKNEDAVFAIGSPTLELFALSYNNTGKNYTIQVKESSSYQSGYEENTEDDCLKIEDNHGIYNKNTEFTWWLASPGTRKELNTNRSSQIMCVNGEKGRLDVGYEYLESKAIRPVVCIPNAVFESKYASSLANE